MRAICNNILENVFGSSVDNILALFKMLSTTTGENYCLKIRVKNRDVLTGFSSMRQINAIKQMDVHLVDTFDNIISTVYSPVKSQYTTFYYNHTTKTAYSYNSIASIITPHVNLDYNSELLVVLYKNVDTVLDNMNTLLCTERRIGETYKFNDPALSNWIITCYGTIITKNLNDKRLHAILKPYECYNEMYVEFNLKTLTSSIITDVLMLIELIYHKDFTKYSLTYNMLHEFHNININNIPKTAILTQMDITKPASDCIFIANSCQHTCFIVCFNNYVYKLVPNDCQQIYYTKSQQDATSLTDVFVCKYDDDSKYYIVDCIMFNNINISNKDYDNRMAQCDEYISTNIAMKKLNISIANKVDIDSWDDVNEYVNNGMSLLYITDDYKKHFIIRSKTDIRIKFLVQRIPFTTKYCLYVKANGKDIVNAFVFNNNYSLMHFNYTITQYHNDGNKYALFDTPYFNTYIIDTSLLNVNIIDSTTYSNEVKQCIKQLLAEVNSNPNVINSQIVECSIVDYGNKFYWLPIKILNNNYAAVDDYKTAIKLSSILFADIDLQDAAEYNRTHVGIVKYSKEFKDIRRLLNRYIVEKFINNYEHTSIVDVFDSENYFVAELYILGCVKNIFCINDNSHSIINYVDALIENKNSQTYNSLLLTTRNEVSPQAVSLKTVEYNMANIKSDIYNKLLNVTLFNINSVDTFILSNNVNKVFTNILNVFALIDVMKFTLTSTGRLLLSFIDNDVEYGNVKKSTKLNFLTYNNKAYANDQHVTVINDDDIRYKGKVYSNIIPDDGYKYPKYSIIPYSAVEHMPVLPMSKMVIHKLAQMFGIDFQYYTSIYTRVLKQFVGVCDYDNTLGAMKQSIFLRTHTNKSVLIADNKLSDDCKEFINTRLEQGLLTLVVTNDKYVHKRLVKLDLGVYMIFPKGYNEKYIKFLQELHVVEFANKYEYIIGNPILQAPIKHIIVDVLCKLGFTLDVISQPYTDTFFTNYVKSLDTVLSENDITTLKHITVASFNNVVE